MKNMDELDDENVDDDEIVEQCYETGHLGEVTRRTMEIQDVSYEKANLHAIASKCTCLPKEVRSALLKLLLLHEDLFDGTLGTWNGPETHLKLRKDAMPHFARSFPVSLSLIRRSKMDKS
jgi:hypothetical protein